MITVTELVVMAHDADRIKGRICGNCRHWWALPSTFGEYAIPQCRKGYGPSGEDDGCDDWRPRADRTAA